MKIAQLTGLISVILCLSCNSNEKKEAPVSNDTLKKATTTPPKDKVSPKKPPIINIVDTVQPKRIIVYIKDSAATFERVNYKLAQIYGTRLTEFFKKNALKPAGSPMAWFITQKAPYFFEAGIPVNKRPTKQMPGIKLKETKADSVVLAHFFGPYDLKTVCYETMNEWMKDHQKHATYPAYEIYVTNPIGAKGKQMDPYKVQTDIVFPRK